MTLGIVLRAASRALGNLRLVAVHWIWGLLLAAIVAVPVAAGLAGILGLLPAGDELLERGTAPLLVELSSEYKPLFGTVQPLIGLAVVLALLAAPLLAGGTLEVLLGDDRRAFGHRFGRGAGRFYGRFLRLGAVAVPITAIAAALLGGPLLRVARKLGENGHETARYAVAAAGLLVVGLVLLFVRMALDLARVATVRDDRRDPVRTFLRLIPRTLRHPLRVIGLWLGLRLPWVALVALHLVVASGLDFTAGWGIALLCASQEVVSYARAGLRVATWAGEIQLAAPLAPPRPTVAEPAPAPAAQVPPPPAPVPPEPPSTPFAPPSAS